MSVHCLGGEGGVHFLETSLCIVLYLALALDMNVGFFSCHRFCRKKVIFNGYSYFFVVVTFTHHHLLILLQSQRRSSAGVSTLMFTRGCISLAVAFKGPSVIHGLYKCNYSLTVK